MAANHSDRVYKLLRQKILNRELMPGSRVRYGPLGKEIGVSATPVREAIGKLASEGLIELVPQTGAVVMRPTREDAVEVYELREAIEPFAAAKACRLIGAPQLTEMEESVSTMRKIWKKAEDGTFDLAADPVAFDRADLAFHLIILEAADNHRMLKAVTDYHLLTAIIGAERHNYAPEVLAMTVQDHDRILEGLQVRDEAIVHQAMLSHIRNSRQLTLSMLDDDRRQLLT